MKTFNQYITEGWSPLIVDLRQSGRSYVHSFVVDGDSYKARYAIYGGTEVGVSFNLSGSQPIGNTPGVLKVFHHVMDGAYSVIDLEPSITHVSFSAENPSYKNKLNLPKLYKYMLGTRLIKKYIDGEVTVKDSHNISNDAYTNFKFKWKKP